MLTTPKQQFIHFLKQNNIYEQFMFNFNNRKKLSTNKFYQDNITFKHFIQHINIQDYIVLAFAWNNTKEGRDFWSETSIKWYRTISNYLITRQ